MFSFCNAQIGKKIYNQRHQSVAMPKVLKQKATNPDNMKEGRNFLVLGNSLFMKQNSSEHLNRRDMMNSKSAVK